MKMRMLNRSLRERKSLKGKTRSKRRKSMAQLDTVECVLSQLQCMVRDNAKFIDVFKYLILY